MKGQGQSASLWTAWTPYTDLPGLLQDKATEWRKTARTENIIEQNKDTKMKKENFPIKSKKREQSQEISERRLSYFLILYDKKA